MPAKSWNDLRDLDDTGFAAKSCGFARDRRHSGKPEGFPRERSHPAKPAASVGHAGSAANSDGIARAPRLVGAALAVGAWLLACGLSEIALRFARAIALVGIVAGTAN